MRNKPLRFLFEFTNRLKTQKVILIILGSPGAATHSASSLRDTLTWSRTETFLVAACCVLWQCGERERWVNLTGHCSSLLRPFQEGTLTRTSVQNRNNRYGGVVSEARRHWCMFARRERQESLPCSCFHGNDNNSNTSDSLPRSWAFKGLFQLNTSAEQDRWFGWYRLQSTSDDIGGVRCPDRVQRY